MAREHTWAPDRNCVAADLAGYDSHLPRRPSRSFFCRNLDLRSADSRGGLMIEPTETESQETLDAFCDAMIQIAREAESNAQPIHDAPLTTPVRLLDQTKADREPNSTWRPETAR